MKWTLSRFQAEYLGAGAETDQVTNSGNVPLKCSKMLNVDRIYIIRRHKPTPSPLHAG